MNRRAPGKSGSPGVHMARLESWFQDAEADFQAGRLGAAERKLKKIRKTQAAIPEVLYLSGIVALTDDRPAIAAGYLQKAVKLVPEQAELLSALGLALTRDGRAAEALGPLGHAVQLQPDNADCHYNLGLALKRTRNTQDALGHFETARRLDPSRADAANDAGTLHKLLGHRDEALQCFVHAVDNDPGHAGCRNNLGLTLHSLGRLDESREQFEQALILNPDDSGTLTNLGVTLQSLGCLDAAETRFREAIEADPYYHKAHTNLIFNMNCNPRSGPAEILAEARRWGDRHESGGARRDHTNDPDPDRRLKIGYVSGDFRRHPVGYFLEPVFMAHDPERLETFCYSSGGVADEITGRLKGMADHWRDIATLDDDGADALIRDDGIDILVDLSGHTGKNRLAVFAKKPAPVQMSGFGINGTTGVAAIDYLIGDRFEIPDGGEAFYSERIVRMDNGYVCYRPPDQAPEPTAAPIIGNGYVTFGCFNNLAKLSNDTFKMWSEILRAIPTARLLLKTHAIDSAASRTRITEQFEGHGIDPGCIDFDGGSPHLELMAAYGRIDIALDPTPYSGGLTTLEALWMGVPVISLAGKTFAARHSNSHLNNAGLSELVAETPLDYVETAIRLASDPARLTGLRSSLRDRIAASPICDGETYTRNLEAVYRQVWRDWCAT
ncbi:MAG: O-linked N-acetylglucosamine transferase, SPINDLY family protein [Alphaproteobacteria bacterium]